ncbi:MAG: tRNA (N(6)-L-threonylcarbamoyladenosine(37)-C(2))-methylthiotransferase MtaB [Clostridia bacterium]|nr:tRNA (N(6)-L-threonylcarbamoyladenosine(37)-C(2))-methylthiotransferase MtaB [Clostridia bacterium]
MVKASLHNLGCKVNSYETEAMEQMLIDAGYEIVPFGDVVKADIYIINTCSVTNIDDRKSRQMLHKAKKQNPDAIVVATGCYVQADGADLINDEAVDIVIGNNRKNQLVRIIEEYMRDKRNNNDVIDISKEREYEKLNINEVCEHTRAYIKVQDGCNQFCSYCIIPYTRGRVRSRVPEDVEAEVTRLADKGYKEFVLTGIHLSSYGIELAESTTLLELIKRVSAIKGVKRIRLGSFEPRILTEEFVSELAKIENVCPHFHISLQSGCDATLKRMNRRYTTAEYAQSCELLRKYFPGAAITTDVIVGFPQETDEEFIMTKEYLEQIHFYEMHVFKYSRRKGTVADRMEGQIAESVKTQRSAILLELEKQMSAQYRRSALQSVQEVLFEETVEKDGNVYAAGYTKTYIRVLALVDMEQADSYINKIVPVRLLSLSEDEEAALGEII